VALPDEPAGWKELQELAQRERDPRELAKILEKMNCLLNEHERRAALNEEPDRKPGRKSSKRRSTLGLQTCQDQA